MHEQEGSWGARARLQELGDAEIDHTRMWRLDPNHGAVMEPEYFDSVRLRLCCALRTRALRGLPERVSRHGRGTRSLLRGRRGHARTQRGHHAGTRSSSVLWWHG